MASPQLASSAVEAGKPLGRAQRAGGGKGRPEELQQGGLAHPAQRGWTSRGAK